MSLIINIPLLWSNVYQPCCVWKTFSMKFHHLWFFKSFSFLFWIILSPKGWDLRKTSNFRLSVQRSFSLCIWSDCVSLYLFPSIARRFFPDDDWTSYKRMSLGVILWQCIIYYLYLYHKYWLYLCQIRDVLIPTSLKYNLILGMFIYATVLLLFRITLAILYLLLFCVFVFPFRGKNCSL